MSARPSEELPPNRASKLLWIWARQVRGPLEAPRGLLIPTQARNPALLVLDDDGDGQIGRGRDVGRANHRNGAQSDIRQI